ncbi:MAG: tetratricopeptide repeat protein [Paracoccaceae bacterium]
MNDDVAAPTELAAAFNRRLKLESNLASDADQSRALELTDLMAETCQMIDDHTLKLSDASADLLIKAAYDLRSAVVSATINQQIETGATAVQTPEFHLDSALHLIRQNKNTEALAALKQAEAAGYSNRAYLNEIKAGVQLSLNNIEPAFDALSLACAAHASPARPARTLLTRFLKKGHSARFADWLRAFSAGIEQSWVHSLLAQIALHDTNEPEAVKEYKAALKLDPTSLNAARALVDIAFRSNDMKLARAVFDLAAPTVVEAAHMQNALARLLMDEKDFDAAMKATASAVEQEPDNSNFWFIRGISLRRGEKLAEALTAFETAVALNPDAAFSFHNLSLCAAQLDLTQRALSAAQRAAELAPANAAFIANLVALGGKKPEIPAVAPKTAKARKPAPNSKPKAAKNANWPRLGS